MEQRDPVGERQRDKWRDENASISKLYENPVYAVEPEKRDSRTFLWESFNKLYEHEDIYFVNLYFGHKIFN